MKKLFIGTALAVLVSVVGWIASSVARMPDYPFDWENH